MIVELGRVTAETKGADLHKLYEPVPVDPWCMDHGHGSKILADCSF